MTELKPRREREVESTEKVESLFKRKLHPFLKENGHPAAKESETIANHGVKECTRDKSPPKPRRVERRFRARPGKGRNQVRAVGTKRIMWQLEDTVKQLELQAARAEELIKQFKVENMMWLEQQEKVATIPTGRCSGGKVKNPQKQE